MHIWAYACVHTHIHLTSHCGPPVRSGAPVPLWFSALWYHAGQIFLSAWMTPWHGVYLDWQLVFIWIDMQRREKRRGWLRRGAIRSAHQSALTWRTWADNGRLEEVEGGQCVTSHYRRLHWRCEILKKNIVAKNTVLSVLHLWFGTFLQLVTTTYVTKDPNEPILTPGQRDFCPVYLFLHLFVFGWNEQYKDAVFRGSLTQQHCQGRANKMSSEWNES